MSSEKLIDAVKGMKLPEHSLRTIFEDYLDFIEGGLPNLHARTIARMKDEPDFVRKCLDNIRAAMLGSSLMMSLDETVNFKELVRGAFLPVALDDELLSMRKELVSRALSQNKDVPGLAGLGMDVVRKRQKIFLDH